MQIKHLKNKDIDFKLWDTIISQSINQLAYAHSWFLDIVSPNWEALVSENYEYIMPLPIKRKYGINYIVQPKLTQQLGIFSKNNIDEYIICEFIKKLPTISFELNLNEQNFHSKALVAPNYILHLNKTHGEISSNYSKNTKRNIEKAKKLNLEIQSKLSIQEFISFYYSVEKKYTSTEQSLVEQLIKTGILENKITIYSVLSADKKIIAALCLLHSTNRITYLLPASNDEGKASSAMFLLIDTIISENSESLINLDFEGSRIDGISRFYKGFGAKNQEYYIIKRFRPNAQIS